MRTIIKIAILLFICFDAKSQIESSENTSRVFFGPEYKVSTGIFYGHHLGLSLNKSRHSLGVGAIFLPPFDINPFKNKWDIGSYLNYDFYPFAKKHRLNFSLNTSLNFLHYQTENYLQMYLFHFIGPGLNAKITQRLNLKTDLGIYTAYYSNSKYGIGLKYNDFVYFSLDNLLLRFSLSYSIYPKK